MNRSSQRILVIHLKPSLLVFFLLIAFLLAPFAVADSSPPTAPASLQSARYSSTTGEVYWTAASDESTIVGYRVIRNGESLGIRDARSVYEPRLEPNARYRYLVSAVDRFGNEGPALEVELSPIVGELLLSD